MGDLLGKQLAHFEGREVIEEVTDTGFNAVEESLTSRTSSGIYFFMKSKFRSSKNSNSSLSDQNVRIDKLAPLLYLAAQTMILSPIIIGHFTTSSADHNGELLLLL